MISFRSINFYLLIAFIIVTFLSLLDIVSVSAMDIAAYALMIWGISFFYSSFIKQYKTGNSLSAVSFLVGTLLFVFSKFEIWNFGTVFIPSALIIIGLSLFISNLLIRLNSISLLFSVLSLFAGVWLLIMRGTATIDLYLSAVFEIAKSCWIIILFLAGIVFLTAKKFKKRNID